MDNLFLKEDYNLKREKVLSSYKQNMVELLNITIALWQEPLLQKKHRLPDF